MIKNGKIFGRQPEFIIQTIASVLAFLVTFGFDGLSVDQATDIVAVLTAIAGLLVASLTREAALSAFTGLAKAGVVLAMAYGLNLSQEQVGTLIIALTAVASAFMWKNNSPKETAVTAA